MLHNQCKANLAETRESILKCLRGDREYGINGTAAMSLLILVICHLAAAVIGALEIHRQSEYDLITLVVAHASRDSEVLFRKALK